MTRTTLVTAVESLQQTVLEEEDNKVRLNPMLRRSSPHKMIQWNSQAQWLQGYDKEI